MADHSEQWGKAYTAPDITVYYDKTRCIHFAACVRGLPEVFDPQARPWIRADRAGASQLAEVVRRCPSGALHALLHPAEENAMPVDPETPQAVTTIEASENGPLFVRGDLRLATPQGERQETRLALCRCGLSQNKPLCDGSHVKGGFQAPASQLQP